ncbi:hypothetical protein TRVL_06421 [Trypanosoma vivax]|nr:hypothetical protein TRVL_06421 [Trypanosoma vivax]
MCKRISEWVALWKSATGAWACGRSDSRERHANMEVAHHTTRNAHKTGCAFKLQRSGRCKSSIILKGVDHHETTRHGNRMESTPQFACVTRIFLQTHHGSNTMR